MPCRPHHSSDTLILARAMFGLPPVRRRRAAGPRHSRADARRLDLAVRPGEIALLTGPSGGGKSSLLRALASFLRRRRAPVIIAEPARLLRARRPVIDLFRAPPARALRSLARAGLADATLLGLLPRELSEGQRWRLSLALAMHRLDAQRQTATLLIDEFASTLDRTTAHAIARSLRRWSWSNPAVRIVCATAHDDLLGALAPDVLAVQAMAGPIRIHRGVRGERGGEAA